MSVAREEVTLSDGLYSGGHLLPISTPSPLKLNLFTHFYGIDDLPLLYALAIHFYDISEVEDILVKWG